MLTKEQIAHFETVGFLAMRQLFSSEEMATISTEFEEILNEDRQGRPFAGENRQAVFAFVEKGPIVAGLADDDRIYDPVEQLLGPEFIWGGSDGNLYVGDTAWHSDSKPDPVEYLYTRIKVALYLDPVTSHTGCLRVIPGSHRPPLHEDLEPLRLLRRMQPGYAGKTVPDDAGPGCDMPFGVESADLPGFSLESQPGDVVFFNQRLWHSSFGGRTGRRMFTLNYGQDPVSEAQVELVKAVYQSSVEAMKKLQSTPTDRIHDDRFLDSDRPRIRRMMAKVKQMGQL